MAGLKAAHDLQQAGVPVIILEASGRIGGRIHTDRQFAPIPIERGAELVHTNQADTWPLIRATHLSIHLLKTTWLKQPNGSWADVKDLATDVMPSFDKAPDPLENLADYLYRMGMERHRWPYALRLLEIDSEPADRWSALEIFDIAGKTREDNEEYGDYDYRVIGGYDRLCQALAESLDIRLNSVVEAIDWQPGAVEVRCSNGLTYSGNRVIVTVPLGVLQRRSIHFVPELSPVRWAAIDALGICDIVKLFFYFDEPVLPAGVDSLIDEAGLPLFWWNGSASNEGFNGEVVVGWAAGAPARELLKMGENAALERGLSSLKKALLRNDLSPLAACWSEWNSDPFTRGAYTFTPPGAIGAREQLAQPQDNTLFFAGEATDDGYGFVHGAYHSGERVAAEVIHSVNIVPA